jgi:hypothetical protein
VPKFARTGEQITPCDGHCRLCKNYDGRTALSIIHALVLAHLASTAVLLAVLWLVVTVQSLGSLAGRLQRRWEQVGRRAASAVPRQSAAVSRFSGVDRRRPVHSSS